MYLPKFMIPKIDFLHTGDWVALYINGELFMQGHEITVHQVLDELNIVHTIKELQVDNDTEYVVFEEKLKDVKVYKYSEYNEDDTLW